MTFVTSRPSLAGLLLALPGVQLSVQRGKEMSTFMES